MLLRKIKNKLNKIKSLLLLIGSLLIIISLSILSYKFLIDYKDNKIEQKNLDNFYKEQEELKENIEDNFSNNEKEIKVDSNYIAVLKIDKINLEKGLYEIGSTLNNVDYNIEILKTSNMPNIENGNLILAGHNGYLSTSYFRNLYKLEASDNVSIFYNGYEYKYKVINTYKVEKTGTVKIVRNKNKTTLTLITCSGDNEQLVVICELVEKI
jgi:sortase A